MWSYVDATYSHQGMLVPKFGDTDHLDLTQVRWILVIEKEVRSWHCVVAKI